jgi:hypothetical protein
MSGGGRTMMYEPAPVDTSNISLSKEILELTEILAENTHEQWARNRINEGWVYGSERNDRKKTHPGLKPYKELSDEEKNYDRVTALETLKVIIKKGYKIEPVDR